MKKILLIGLTLWFLSCSTPPEKPVEVSHAQSLHPDLLRVVPAENFNTDYPEWQSLGAWESAREVRGGVELSWSNGLRLRWELVEGPALRIRSSQNGNFIHQSYAVLEEPALVEARVVISPNEVSLEVPTLRVVIRNNQASLFFGGNLVETLSLPEWAQGSQRFRVRFQGEAKSHWYGLGTKAWGLRLNGRAFHFWNTDTYGYKRGTDPIYSSVPFALRSQSQQYLGVFLDNPAQSYFFLGDESQPGWMVGALGRELDLYLIPARLSSEVLKTYTSLTGRSPLPPLWSLSYQQSRYSYTDADELMAVAEVLRSSRLPSDVLYLDIDVMNRFRSFTINTDAFPNMADLLAKLRRMGFKVVTILDPGIAKTPGYHVYDQLLAKGFFVRNAAGSPVEAKVWPGVCIFPDFTRAETRGWWGGLYRPLLDLGFAGFWNDMNEPAAFDTPTKTIPFESFFDDFGRNSPHALVHNVYGITMARATYEGLRALRNDERPFVLSRAGYAGLQRWAAQWTGDNVANWDHLALNLTMGLNMGLSGVVFNGADVGGYVGTPEPELFVRWMQLGALFPLYRNHTGKDTDMQEPWNFGEEALKASRQIMEWRFRMLPLFYSLFYESTQTGAPLVRPLFWHEARDERTFLIEDQALLGQHLMVAPVLQRGQRRRTVYFPAGTVWFDWYTSQEYVGGREYEVEAPLDRLPLFVRGGGIVPTGELMQYVGERPRNLYTIRVYPGGSGSATVYWDDGQSLAYQRGAYLSTKISFSSQQRQMRIVLTPQNRPVNFQTPEFVLIRLYQVFRPNSVLVNERPIRIQGDSMGVIESDQTSSWYENDRTLLIKLFNPAREQVIDLSF
jgi:alpha-glucosidase